MMAKMMKCWPDNDGQDDEALIWYNGQDDEALTWYDGQDDEALTW